MAKSRSVIHDAYSLMPGTTTYNPVPGGAGRVTVETVPDLPERIPAWAKLGLAGALLPEGTTDHDPSSINEATRKELAIIEEHRRAKEFQKFSSPSETEGTIPAWVKLGLLGELLPKGTREYDPSSINEAIREEEAILRAFDQAKLMKENAAYEAKPVAPRDVVSRVAPPEAVTVNRKDSIVSEALDKGRDISNNAKADHGERSILAGLLTNAPGEIMGSQPVSGGWDRFFKILSKMGARNNVSLVQDFIMGNLDVTKDEAAVYANLVKQQNLEADRRLKREDLSLRRAANEQRIAAEEQRLSIARERLAMSTWPNTKATIERVQNAIAAGLEDGAIKGGDRSWRTYIGAGKNEAISKEMTDRVLAILRDSAANGTDMSIVDAANQAVGSSSSSNAPIEGLALPPGTKIVVTK